MHEEAILQTERRELSADGAMGRRLDIIADCDGRIIMLMPPEIVTCIDFDPSDIAEQQVGRDDVRRLLAGSPLESQVPLDGVGLHAIEQPENADIASFVAEYYLQHRFAADWAAGLVGGYAFLEGRDYLFGADTSFSLSREWDRAINRLPHTAAQDVHIHDLPFKLISVSGFVRVTYRGVQWQRPTAEALRLFNNAKSVKGRFIERFMARIAKSVTSEMAKMIEDNCFGKAPRRR